MTTKTKWIIAGVAVAAVIIFVARAKASPKPKTAIPGAPANNAPDLVVYQFDPSSGSFMFQFGAAKGTMTPVQSTNSIVSGVYSVDLTDYSSGVYQFIVKDNKGNMLRAGTIDSVNTY